MNHNSRVIKFPKRGRFAEKPPLPMTPERRARGNAWLARIRKALQEVGHE